MIPNRKFFDTNSLKSDIYIDDYGNPIKNKYDVERSEKVDFDYTNNDYKFFLLTLNQLLLDRKTTILSKQANIFTTNIDIFFEKNLESLELHYND
jgi:hypothetical protein